MHNRQHLIISVLVEDVDFSLYRIQKLIVEGEKDAERILSTKGVIVGISCFESFAAV
jgi:hypothetical protein